MGDVLPRRWSHEISTGKATSAFSAASCSPNGKALASEREATEEVERLLEEDGLLTLPKTLKGCIKPQPRNPDIVAYRLTDRSWRFCEAKRNWQEQPKNGQLQALAVLRDLLAPLVDVKAEVVRVVAEEEQVRSAPRPYPCQYTVAERSK